MAALFYYDLFHKFFVLKICKILRGNSEVLDFSCGNQNIYKIHAIS